jgi:hypothetical protein
MRQAKSLGALAALIAMLGGNEKSVDGYNRKSYRAQMKASGYFGRKRRSRPDGFAGHTYCAAAH